MRKTGENQIGNRLGDGRVCPGVLSPLCLTNKKRASPPCSKGTCVTFCHVQEAFPNGRVKSEQEEASKLY